MLVLICCRNASSHSMKRSSPVMSYDSSLYSARMEARDQQPTEITTSTAHDERLALGFGLGAVLLWSTVATGFKLGLEQLAVEQLLWLGSLISWLVFHQSLDAAAIVADATAS